MEKYYNPFKEKTVKENDEYVLGLYVNRVPIYGLYIEGEEKFVKELEIKAKAKFKLECDAENFAQQVRVYYYIVLDKYLEKFGEPKNDEDKHNMEKYISKGCLNKLRDLSRCMKSKTSYYDLELEQVVFNSVISLDNAKELSKENFFIDNLEYTICSKEKEKHYSEFGLWFDRIKGEILTKKQLEYLNDSTVVSDKNKKTIEKNIIKRIDRNYSDISIRECKIFEVRRKIRLLEEILDSDTNKEFLFKIVSVLDDEDWLVEELYSLEFNLCKNLTDATKGVYTNDKKSIYKISQKIICKIEELEKINTKK